MFVSVIIAAGGRGVRLGRDVPKQWLTLGGRTILDLSVAAFDRHDRVNEIVVVLPPAELSSANFSRPAAATAIRFVAGGERRQDSVASGFDAVSPQSTIVLVHDAARPFVTAATIDRAIDAANASGAALPALPVHDTVKQAVGGEAPPIVERTLARETIFLAQTPQAFRRDVLAEAVALGRRGVEATDEAMLAELAGHRVRLVEGDPRNMKITTDLDLARAKAIAETGAAPIRIGVGYDLHRLEEGGRPLVIGGVTVPFDRGPVAHSDGDAVCHAVTDAILGAANLGDIGTLFPDTDPAWRDANSVKLLAAAVARVHDAGWTIQNVDVVVVAERPKIGPYAGAMRAVLAPVLGVQPDAVGIKGKTNEGVDATGRGEAIAVHAVALISRR
jgi:2-C-methyl-D-erythritol 4-phosphate cytidylyltransferase / 2-C-methyl-D-erythritol 2,4-cyclodiphosphate synthase